MSVYEHEKFGDQGHSLERSHVGYNLKLDMVAIKV